MQSIYRSILSSFQTNFGFIYLKTERKFLYPFKSYTVLLSCVCPSRKHDFLVNVTDVAALEKVWTSEMTISLRTTKTSRLSFNFSWKVFRHGEENSVLGIRSTFKRRLFVDNSEKLNFFNFPMTIGSSSLDPGDGVWLAEKYTWSLPLN